MDPDDHQLQRYWDGTQWTSDRRPIADTTAAAPGTETLANSRANRGLASMRRIADAATHSAVAHKVADAATAAGHTIAETAKDPVQMKRVTWQACCWGRLPGPLSQMPTKGGA